ncbi:MAG TPA: CHAP domain-containing protein [Myxococcales bacterium]|jgi:hypothetical protein|nr:CHAP domain-containing protein [Myxococcales bacterium]
MRPLAASLALPLCCACAASGVALRREASPAQVRAQVVRSARSFLGEKRLTVAGRALPPDCWALPVAAYARSGLALGGGDALGLYRAAAGLGRLYSGRRPKPGDLVFLEADPGSARSDVHVGLVGSVDDDGTVTVYQRMARGVIAYRMNAAHPDDPVAPGSGRPWNDRIASGGQSRLAGQLFAAYAAFLP